MRETLPVLFVVVRMHCDIVISGDDAGRPGELAWFGTTVLLSAERLHFILVGLADQPFECSCKAGERPLVAEIASVEQYVTFRDREGSAVRITYEDEAGIIWVRRRGLH